MAGRRNRTAAEVVKVQVEHAKAEVDDAGHRVRDLPTLIAWAHLTKECGLDLARRTARRQNRPKNILGLDMEGRVWPWLVAELHGMTGIAAEELWEVAVCQLVGRSRFDLNPDVEPRYEGNLEKLRAHERQDPECLGRLIVELRERFPVAADQLPSRCLVLHPDDGVATVNGERFPLTRDHVSYVQAVIQKRGGWVPADEVEPLVSRVDRLRKKMPPAVCECIEAKPGLGSRLLVPAGIV